MNPRELFKVKKINFLLYIEISLVYQFSFKKNRLSMKLQRFYHEKERY
jgi:hypothetical protein